MATLEQVKRRQQIQLAEGYLELAELFADSWPLDGNQRKILAERAIQALSQVQNPLGYKPHIYYLKGQAHRIAGRLNLARRCFLKSSRLDPDNLHCLLALAWCYKRTEELDKAIEAMIIGLRLEPESAITHYNLACYSSLAKDTERALVHLAIALDLNPEYLKLMQNEPDFDPIRELPRFQELLQVHA
jgi:tetratricopeptide (TPR) repeat protein